MKTYAYITTEACRLMDAVKPGSYIGRDEIPVSKHGDYTPWTAGKRETLALIHDQRTPDYQWRAALFVASLLGWQQ